MYRHSNYSGYQADKGSAVSPVSPMQQQQKQDPGYHHYENVGQKYWGGGSNQMTRRYPSGRDTSPGHTNMSDARRPQFSSQNLNGSYLGQDRSRSNDQALDNTKETWDYLQAEMDLSPRSGEGHVPRSSVREYDTGPGQARQPSASGYPRYGTQGQTPSSRSLLSLTPKVDLDLSTASKDSAREYSDPSTGTPRKDGANLSRSSTMERQLTHADIHQSVLSYRERWERSRRDRDSLHLNRSSSEPNRTTPNRSRLDSTGTPYSGEANRSRSYDGAERNRSILSSTRDLDLNRSTNTEINRSALSGTLVDQSMNGSLRRDPVTHRKIPTSHQNGVAKPVRDSNSNLSHQSRGSLSRSRSSLSRGSPKVTLYGHDYGVHNSLVNMAFYSLLSLVFCALGLQLLLRLNAREAEGLVSTDSVLQSNDSYHGVQAVAVTFSSAVVMLNLCCVLTCSLQCFFAAKLVKCPQGEERAFKYIKECTGTRFIAVAGFFVSIPIFFLAIMLYILMEYRATAAIIAVVITTVGVSFTISTLVHSTFFWKVEKARADRNVPPYDPEEEAARKKKAESTLSQSELSTLV